jgi:hypothetical protein
MTTPSLEVISEKESSTVPDDFTRKEQAALKIRRLEAELQSLKNDTDAKKTYAQRIFVLAAAWLFIVLLMLVFQGFSWFGWNLANSVLIALVAGATTGVLGLMASVLAYIFRAQRPANTARKK